MAAFEVVKGYDARDLSFWQTKSKADDKITTEVKELENGDTESRLAKLNLDSIDNHDKPFYDVELNYRLPVTKGGSSFLWGGTFSVLRRKWQPATVRIHNAKGREAEFTHDAHGYVHLVLIVSYIWTPLGDEVVLDSNGVEDRPGLGYLTVPKLTLRCSSHLISGSSSLIVRQKQPSSHGIRTMDHCTSPTTPSARHT